jgi:hypothetical protein
MSSISLSLRGVAVAAALCAAGAANAAFTFATLTGAGTAATFATNVSGKVDSFNDLIINSDLGTSSLTRSAGPIGYMVSTESNLYTVQTNGIGGASLTVNGNTDTLTFGSFQADVRAFGVRFFLTDLTYGANAGTMKVVATDNLGATQSFTYSQTVNNSTSGPTEPVFLSLKSTIGLQSVQLFPPAVGANPNVFATVDNLVLSAVPEPGTWMMMLVGCAAMLRTAARRRA